MSDYFTAEEQLRSRIGFRFATGDKEAENAEKCP